MGDKIEMTLDGFEGTIAAFKELRDFVRGNPVRTALRQAGKLLQGKLESTAPIGGPNDPFSGRLVANFMVRMRARAGEIHARVAVNTEGKADSERNAFYWRFVEYGHAMPNGVFIPPNPFITHAVTAFAQDAAQIVIDSFEAAVGRAEKRAAKFAKQL